MNAMMLMPAKPGTCAMCATEHDANEPHNYWSLFYGVRFKMQHGRDATHADCIAHLSAEFRTREYPLGKVKNMPALINDFDRLREDYKSILAANGREWTEAEEPIAEPYLMSGKES